MKSEIQANRNNSLNPIINRIKNIINKQVCCLAIKKLRRLNQKLILKKNNKMIYTIVTSRMSYLVNPNHEDKICFSNQKRVKQKE